jgi:hypothetical protein
MMIMTRPRTASTDSTRDLASFRNFYGSEYTGSQTPVILLRRRGPFPFRQELILADSSRGYDPRPMDGLLENIDFVRVTTVLGAQ